MLETGWAIWLGNAQGKLELGCKNQKLAGFVFVFTVSSSLKFQQSFKTFSQILHLFTVANEVQLIGKDLVTWRSQKYSHHTLGADLFLKQVQTSKVNSF